MAGTPFKAGPAAVVVTTATDIANLTPSSSATYRMVRHVHVENKTGTAATFSAYLGATGGTAAGTELVFGKDVAANDVYDMYWPSGLKMTSTDFMSVFSGTTLALTVTVAGESYATA
jgi:hypothetical protein